MKMKPRVELDSRMTDPKFRGRGSGGVTGKGFKPGQNGNPMGQRSSRGYLTAVMTHAMVRKMGEPIPGEPDRSYAGRIGSNAVIVLDEQFEQCRKNKTFNRDIIPLIEFVADRLEGKPTQPITVTKGVEARSDEELMYYTYHKHFPDEPCICPDNIQETCPAPPVSVTNSVQ